MPEKEVTIKIKYQTVGKEKAKESEKSIKNLGKQTKATTTSMGKSLKGLGYNLTFIAWHFRYLGNIFQQVSRQMVRFMKEIIETGIELQESFFSIQAAAALYGQEAEAATVATWELAEKGLVPLTSSASIVRNLLMTGLGLPEIERFMYRYLDVAALTTSGMNEMSKSLELMTTSILRGTTVLATDRTARMIWDMTNRRLQETLGVTIKQLDKERSAMEILITIEKEFAGTEGLHRAEMEMTQAALLRMKTAWQSLQYVLAEGFKPIIIFIAEIILKVTGFIKNLLGTLGVAVPIFIAVNTAIITVSASLFFFIGVVLSFVKIINTATKMLWEMSAAQAAAGNAAAGHALKIGLLSGALKAFSIITRFAIPILLLFDAIAMAVAYTMLKGTGAFEKQTEAAKKIEDQIKSVSDALKEFGTVQEEVIGGAEEIDEGRRIAHKRRVEDITEDLERERSKGLWANQMSIKDLEKRLRRENEDWTRYQTGLAKGEIKQTKTAKTELELRFDKILEIIEENKKRIADAWADVGKMSLNEYMEGMTKPTIWKEGFEEMARIVTKEFPRIIRSWNRALEIWMQQVILTLVFLPNEMVATVERAAKGVKAVWDTMIMGMYLAFPEPIDRLFTWIGNRIRDLKEDIDDLKVGWENLGRTLGRFPNLLRLLLPAIIPGFPKFQFGGIVPGPIGKPMPIIAHGGERIVPSREPSGGNITININASVRENEDINRIARAVSQALGQRQKFARLGGL